MGRWSTGSEVSVIHEAAEPFGPDAVASVDPPARRTRRLRAMSDPDAPEQRRSDGATDAAPSTARSTAGATPDSATDAALRDADAIAKRIAADERAADEERERLVRGALPRLTADVAQAFQARPGEMIHAVRHAAIVERGADVPLAGGTLYLTSQRLVHVGRDRIEEIELERIADMAVAIERLLLVEMADGTDLAVEVDGPRLLRVQVAAARAALRERTG